MPPPLHATKKAWSYLARRGQPISMAENNLVGWIPRSDMAQPKPSPTRNKHKGISQKYANMSFDRNKTKRTKCAKKVQNIFLLLQRVAPNGCNGAGNKRCLDLSAANLLHTCPGMSQFYLCTMKTNKIQLIWGVVKAF